MSVYGVHKLLQHIRNDAGFRQRLQTEPELALDAFPLTFAERSALRSGAVGSLHAMGVHGYMLNTLARYGVFGLTVDQYLERIRQPGGGQ